MDNGEPNKRKQFGIEGAMDIRVLKKILEFWTPRGNETLVKFWKEKLETAINVQSAIAKEQSSSKNSTEMKNQNAAKADNESEYESVNE